MRSLIPRQYRGRAGARRIGPRTRRLAIGLAAGLAAAPGIAEDTPRGAELITPFKVAMQRALKAGLAEGPVEAIGACRIRAPQIAHSLSRNGAVVGRTSHRLRNPDNTPPDWVRPLLDGFAAAPTKATAKEVTLRDGRLGYVEPIFIKPPCLVCHGETIPEPVAQKIRELYPEDRATGFREGDFRGLFWAEYPGPI